LGWRAFKVGKIHPVFIAWNRPEHLNGDCLPATGRKTGIFLDELHLGSGVEDLPEEYPSNPISPCFDTLFLAYTAIFGQW
jgi:hypothetical protein